MNDFSSPIMDQLIPIKNIPNKTNTNLFEKFITGNNENNNNINPISNKINCNMITKNINNNNQNSIQNPYNLYGIVKF